MCDQTCSCDHSEIPLGCEQRGGGGLGHPKGYSKVAKIIKEGEKARVWDEKVRGRDES